ncbi:hypothetical protein OK006_10967 [Actinobacteria bacterium OK006]|nr:hypothetical protein OK006_10967 [Actinobacteria bacterium OK006]
MSSGLSRRRVEGLRREEVAMAAGISLDYYTRVEQGRVEDIPPDILNSLAQVLQLTDEQTRELHHPPDHADNRQNRPAASSRADRQAVAPVLAQTLNALADTPALVTDRGMTVLAWNRPAAALLGDFARLKRTERNVARLVFLDTRWRSLFADWRAYARFCVDNLRRAAQSNPDDAALVGLIGELSVKNVDFRRYWAQRPKDKQGSPVIAVHHPAAGPVHVVVDTLFMADNPRQALLVHRPLDVTSAGKLRVLMDTASDMDVADYAPAD